MRRLVYLASAQRDLDDILDYLAKESTSVAIGLKFTGRLRAQCRKLATLPGTLGRARPELRADIRSFAFKGYVIFFRYETDKLVVVKIVEGQRDIDAMFKDDIF